MQSSMYVREMQSCAMYAQNHRHRLSRADLAGATLGLLVSRIDFLVGRIHGSLTARIQIKYLALIAKNMIVS